MQSEKRPEPLEWKQRLYESYVSSGQAGTLSTTPEETFRPRKIYIQNLIQDHFPPDRQAKILDVGCGHGAFLYFLSKAGYTDAHGIDTSAEQIAKARDLGITTAERRPAYEYLRHLPDARLDVVLLFDILEHLEKQELFDMLDEVHRVLRPGGTCLIHVPNGEGIFGMRVRFGDLTHVQAFTQNSARQLLTTIGFSQVASFEERPIPHGIKSMIRWFLWQMGTLPARLLFAAERGSTDVLLSANFLVRARKS